MESMDYNAGSHSGWLVPLVEEHCLELYHLYYKRMPLESCKQDLQKLSADGKKQKLLAAVDELTTNPKLTDDHLNVCFRILQDLALSPRVSNLNSLNLYARRVEVYEPRPPLLNMSSYLFQKECEEKRMFLIEDVDAFPDAQQLGDSPKWIVLKYGRYMHQTLLRIFTEEKVRKLQIFDSIGMSAAEPLEEDSSEIKFYKAWLQKVERKLHIADECPKIEYIRSGRQRDSINCLSFVSEDFRVAEKLISENEPLFEKGKENPEFLRISQAPSQITFADDSDLRRPGLSDEEPTRNVKAKLIALDFFRRVLEEKVEFPEANAVPEVASESDEEEGCIIS